MFATHRTHLKSIFHTGTQVAALQLRNHHLFSTQFSYFSTFSFWEWRLHRTIGAQASESSSTYLHYYCRLVQSPLHGLSCDPMDSWIQQWSEILRIFLENLILQPNMRPILWIYIYRWKYQSALSSLFFQITTAKHTSEENKCLHSIFTIRCVSVCRQYTQHKCLLFFKHCQV